MSSQSTEDVVLRRKVAKLENARKVERMERMVRDLQATVERKDLEQKMERMQAQAQATLDKKDLEQKMEKRHMEQMMERMQAQAQATLEKKDLEQKMERMQAQATSDKNDLEQKMEKRHMEQKMVQFQAQAQAQAMSEKKDLEQKMERMQAQATSEKKDLEQKMERMQAQVEKKDLEQKMEKNEADVSMRLENEKRDRLLENEKRDREADKKEAQAQHQIDQLKWEARFSQMEQQQAARAYNIQPLSNPLQYAAGTVLPLAPQRETKRQLQPAPLHELRPREEQTGPSHLMTLVTAIQQPVLLDSTAKSAALPSAPLPSAALPSLVMARPQAASVLQPVQHQHLSSCNTPTPSRPLQHQQVQHQQQQHQVTAGLAAARIGPVPLPANAHMHFFLSHCQGTGGDQTNAIYLELKQLGFSCW
jgi:hypothetical protein